MKKRIGLCLSGCGMNDGSEIHESVITILALDSLDVDIVYMAPNITQKIVNNHLINNNSNETRNVLTESARISRGNILDIVDINHDNLDALIFPGGYGAVLNLCDFALNGSSATVQKDVFNLIASMINNNKPLGVICIAPAMLACVLRDLSLSAKLTIGNDKDVAMQINNMGCKHIDCKVNDIVFDPNLNIVSTPAYMLAENILQAKVGIDNLVKKIVDIIK